jgi:hypothetical protein
MPLIETKGAASAQGFGGAGAGASGPVTYIEDVFSTYLYTGNDAALTVTNGIDLATKGGMVWGKSRSASQNHRIYDTARGSNYSLITNGTGAQSNQGANACAFNTDGFSLSAASGIVGSAGFGGPNYVSWTFREQPKFFDIVTYTGDGANRTISHNLGSVPGCIIVKRTDAAADWQVYHRSLANTEYIVLNSTAAVATGTTRWNSTTPTSTVFSLGTDTTVNANGGTYVAYLFAHDAGGFGLTGTDNVISCGSYTGNGSTGQLINLGYEPQWVLIKQTDAADQWAIIDNMRGWAQSDSATLCANTANAENADFSASGATSLDPQGFRLWNANGALNQSGGTYIYIAIRRGPMKVPTSGTSVFAPVTYTGTATAATLGSLQVNDLSLFMNRSGTTNTGSVWYDRLRGLGRYLQSSNSAAEANDTTTVTGFDTQTGVKVGIDNQGTVNATTTYVLQQFRRAPSFFDVVCYTGTGSAQTLAHNLGAVPELMIVKWRTGATGDNWNVYHSAIGATGALYLNKTDPTVGTAWNNTAPTATQFTVGTQGSVNAATYVAYLFATVAGVSKVGSYTGTGALQTINCGFTGGARFVLIKRTDSTGDWYVYDSARGISSGNDPYLLLNSTAAEVTGTNYVDTTSVGFQVTAAAPAGLNANGGTYIFLAIA